MPKQQPTPDFHDSATFNCEWSQELREVHGAARDTYGAYLSFDWLEQQARTHPHEEIAGAVTLYQALAADAYALVQRIDAHGAALVAAWEAGQRTEAERAYYARCEQCGRDTSDHPGHQVPGPTGPRYVCEECYHTDAERAAAEQRQRANAAATPATVTIPPDTAVPGTACPHCGAEPMRANGYGAEKMLVCASCGQTSTTAEATAAYIPF